MADLADQASELIAERESDAIRSAVSGMNRGPSLTFCVDCDGVIPHKRRALGGMRRCVECQHDLDRRTRRG